MRIIPVLDLMNGQVVRGVAGRREEYRAVESRLVESARPVEVAQAFREKLGLEELYLADLDAIRGESPDLGLYRELARQGFRLLVDAGVWDKARATAVAEAGVRRVVVGLETLPRPGLLAELVAELSSEQVVFSLDLNDGKPLGDLSAWQAGDAESMAREVLTLGIRRMIVLDLARVGVGGGVGTDALCRRLRETHPDLEIITGGGVRGRDDLVHLAQTGVDGVLVASALHDGRIGRDEIDRFHKPNSR